MTKGLAVPLFPLCSRLLEGGRGDKQLVGWLFCFVVQGNILCVHQRKQNKNNENEEDQDVVRLQVNLRMYHIY